MKKTSALLLAVLLLAIPAAEAAAPKKKDPASSRRTLFATVGQTTMVFEAPKGMCFMDESRGTESAVLKAMKDTAKNSGDLLVAVFADCKELAGLGVVDAGDSFALKRTGSIVWADAKKSVPRKLTREEYIAARAPTFREDAWNDMLQAFTKNGKAKKRVQGALTTTTYMANPEDYNFDARPRVSDSGVSLAYGVDAEVENKKLTTQAIIGATLIRHVPMEFQISMSGDRSAVDFDRYYSLMEGFMQQQVKLNK